MALTLSFNIQNRIMMRLFFSLLFFSISINIFAVNVEGRVIDKDTKEVIVNATVIALSNNKVLASASSNSKGKFKINLKDGKKIHIEVVKDGYKTESADVVINKEFIAANPFIEIKLAKENSTKEVNDTKEVIENIGDLGSLPKGSKIIEAVPVKEKDYKTSKFNVRPETKDQNTSVNVKVLKEEYNKGLKEEALEPNFNFTTSYYKDGSIYYNVGKAFLSNDVKEILKGVAKRLKNEPETTLQMLAFADANKELKIGEYISKLRIEEIVNLLVNEGVNFKQLDISIIGNQMVRNDCTEGVKCTEEQHQENRKVEFSFVK